jgi:hypothetical protein
MTVTILAKLSVLKQQSEILIDLKGRAIMNHKTLNVYRALDEIHQEIRAKQNELIKVS